MYHRGYGESAGEGLFGVVLSLLLIVALVTLLIMAFLIVMGIKLIINGFIMAPRGSKCWRWLWGSAVGWLGSWIGAAVIASSAGPNLAQSMPARFFLVTSGGFGLVCLIVLLITAKVAVTLYDEMYQSPQTPAA